MILSFVLITLFLFIVGVTIGSFLNVVVMRTITGEQWLTGRSHCDHCGQGLPFYDNIPLFSYLILGGKSRCCQQTLSPAHPVVEFLIGALVVWWYWIGFIFFQVSQQPAELIQPFLWLVVGILLIGILVADLRYYLIPNVFLYPLLLLVLGYRLVLVSQGIMQITDFVFAIVSALGSTLFFLSLLILTKGKGLGFGDVKYVFVMGLLLGWPRILVGLLSAFVSGSIIGSLLVFSQRKKLKDKVPFGPFLVFGTFIALVWGEGLLNWYLGLLGL